VAYYETKDGVKEVAPLYEAEMPKKGWEKIAWLDFEGVSQGWWWKGEIYAGTNVDDKEGKTNITIWRGKERK